MYHVPSTTEPLRVAVDDTDSNDVSTTLGVLLLEMFNSPLEAVRCMNSGRKVAVR